jgi:hypothetical protein
MATARAVRSSTHGAAAQRARCVCQKNATQAASDATEPSDTSAVARARSIRASVSDDPAEPPDDSAVVAYDATQVWNASAVVAYDAAQVWNAWRSPRRLRDGRRRRSGRSLLDRPGSLPACLQAGALLAYDGHCAYWKQLSGISRARVQEAEGGAADLGLSRSQPPSPDSPPFRRSTNPARPRCPIGVGRAPSGKRSDDAGAPSSHPSLLPPTGSCAAESAAPWMQPRGRHHRIAAQTRRRYR